MANLTEEQAQFIVIVLLSHPCPSLPEELRTRSEKERTSIVKRYRQLKKDLSFTDAEIQSKKEWLQGYLSSQAL